MSNLNNAVKHVLSQKNSQWCCNEHFFFISCMSLLPHQVTWLYNKICSQQKIMQCQRQKHVLLCSIRSFRALWLIGCVFVRGNCKVMSKAILCFLMKHTLISTFLSTCDLGLRIHKYLIHHRSSKCLRTSIKVLAFFIVLTFSFLVLPITFVILIIKVCKTFCDSNFSLNKSISRKSRSILLNIVCL